MLHDLGRSMCALSYWTSRADTQIRHTLTLSEGSNFEIVPDSFQKLLQLQTTNEDTLRTSNYITDTRKMWDYPGIKPKTYRSPWGRFNRLHKPVRYPHPAHFSPWLPTLETRKSLIPSHCCSTYRQLTRGHSNGTKYNAQKEHVTWFGDRKRNFPLTIETLCQS